MKIILTKLLTANEPDIKTAAKILQKGGLVAIPTETVYGLAANAFDEKAIKNIFSAKGRPQDNPLIVHIADLAWLPKLCKVVPKEATKVMETFWPGPLTILFYKSPLISNTVTCGLDTVAIRFPENETALSVIRAAGVPLAAPSANSSGKPSPTLASHVSDDLNGKIDAIIDGGPCLVGVESTVIDLTCTPARLLRPGGITLEQLQAVLPEIEADPSIYTPLKEGQKPRSPGQKYRHYAPKAELVIVTGKDENVLSYIHKNLTNRCGVLCYDEYSDFFGGATVFTYGEKNDLSTQAQRLFAMLRRFDQTNVNIIYAQCPNDQNLGLAISNRLKKAAGFHMINADLF